jgi:hypothetical protein
MQSSTLTFFFTNNVVGVRKLGRPKDGEFGCFWWEIWRIVKYGRLRTDEPLD